VLTCPLEGIMKVLSKKWSLMVIETIGNKDKVRFSELMTYLTGIPPKSLTNRLKEQEKAGLIRRTAFAEIPPKVEYSLTQDGIRVREALGPLFEWASEKQAEREDIPNLSL
jgi:DNA-binding HxlR family transcriptional regulator